MRRFGSTLATMARRLPIPRDRYHGTRRPDEGAPDNVLAFTRRSFQELGYHAGGSFHERWVLLLALAGQGVVRLDNAWHAIEPGQAILVPPLRLHGYPRAEARLCWLFVTFEWPGHTPDGEVWPGPRPVPVATRQLLRRMLEEQRAPEGRASVLTALLLEVLRDLRPPARLHAPATGPHSLLEAVRLAAAEAQPPRVAEVARRLGLAQSHLRARFRAEAGVSLGRYLREARLRAAALALREHNLSVKQAAEMAGYADAFTFSKAFHKVLGHPPSAW